MSDFIEALRSEHDAARKLIAVRESEVIHANERLKRAQTKASQLQALIATYETDAPARLPDFQAALPFPELRTEANISSENSSASEVAAAAPQHEAMSKRAQMDAETDALIRRHGSIKRQDLLAHLKAKNIMGHEKNPPRALSVLLASFSDKYVTDGQGNYSFRAQPPTTEETLKELDTDQAE